MGQGALILKMFVLAESPGAGENGLLVPMPRAGENGLLVLMPSVYDSLGLWSGLEIRHLLVSEWHCCKWAGL